MPRKPTRRTSRKKSIRTSRRRKTISKKTSRRRAASRGLRRRSRSRSCKMGRNGPCWIVPPCIGGSLGPENWNPKCGRYRGSLF